MHRRLTDLIGIQHETEAHRPEDLDRTCMQAAQHNRVAMPSTPQIDKEVHNITTETDQASA